MLLFLGVSGIGLLADLASKHYVFQSMLGQADLRRQVQALLGRSRVAPAPTQLLHEEALRRYLQRQVLPGVRFTLSTNPGVVFGLDVPRPAVAIATLAALALVAVLFATSDARFRSIHLALGFIMAGALGNLYDRLFVRIELPGDGAIEHQVRDFIDCSQLHYPWVFNVADVLLVAGVAVLLVHWWLVRDGEGQAR